MNEQTTIFVYRPYVITLLGVVAGIAFTPSMNAMVIGGGVGLIVECWFRYMALPQLLEDEGVQQFSMHSIRLLAKFAKADGKVDVKEIEVFRKNIEISPQDEKAVADLFNAAKKSSKNYRVHAEALAELASGHPDLLHNLVQVMYRMALCEGVWHVRHRNFVYDCATLWGVSPKYLRGIEDELGITGSQHTKSRAYVQKNADEEPYHVLGVSAASSYEEIRKKFKRLIRENHPDKVRAGGATEVEIKKAEARMARYNAAYEKVGKKKSPH